MNNIENYKRRFFSLMESTMGDVKPLINEEDSKNFCLKKYGDTSLPQYQNCMFMNTTPENFDGRVTHQVSEVNKIYGEMGDIYEFGRPFRFRDSSGKTVRFIQTRILDIGGIPKFLKDPVVKQVLDYMVNNKFIERYDRSNPGKSFYDLLKNKSIAKKGNRGEVIVSLPKPSKEALGASPITDFIYWPKANVYYYDTETPTNFIFTDDGSMDDTFLDLIQNRI